MFPTARNRNGPRRACPRGCWPANPRGRRLQVCTAPLSLPASKVNACLPAGVPPATPGLVPGGRKSASVEELPAFFYTPSRETRIFLGSRMTPGGNLVRRHVRHEPLVGMRIDQVFPGDLGIRGGWPWRTRERQPVRGDRLYLPAKMPVLPGRSSSRPPVRPRSPRRRRQRHSVSSTVRHGDRRRVLGLIARMVLPLFKYFPNCVLLVVGLLKHLAAINRLRGNQTPKRPHARRRLRRRRKGVRCAAYWPTPLAFPGHKARCRCRRPTGAPCR